MIITSLKAVGPVLDARVPIPRPDEGATSPYAMDDFLDDLRCDLDGYGDPDGRARACASSDGTCYWIRADMDSGTAFLRVFVDETGDLTEGRRFEVENCSGEGVPGEIRLN